MKLKSNFITHSIGDEQVMVSVDTTVFSGIVKSNKTAAAIVDMLKEDTDKDKITDALYARYNAPRDVISKDVDNILSKLREIGAIDE